VDITRRFARYAVISEPGDVPEAARREAVRSLVNWIGCAVGGARHEAVELALAALVDYQALPQAAVFGRRERLDAAHAALVNGISSHVFDFDDTQLRTLLHPSVPVASALFALSEKHAMSGREFLHAFIVGVEIESRVANAIYANHNSDWYITGTAGPFGAAAAVGRVLGLDEERMTWALGIAATAGSGLRQMAGTMAKSFVHGRAAQNGLYAALLAAQGFTSSVDAIEGGRGFARVVGGITDVTAMLDGLGETYEISSNTYKPYACGVVAHAVIDGCLRLREQHRLEASTIRRVDLKVHPQALKLTGIRNPASGLESKWSIYHSAAAALVTGRAGEHEYGDACVADPVVAALRNRVSAAEDPGLTQDEAHVRLELDDGRVLQYHVAHALGSVDRPMSDADLGIKFKGLAEPILGPGQADRLLQLCRDLPQLPDVAQIPLASRPAEIEANGKSCR
jgi:2-methylcitrate dehydratase PrpD